MHRDESKDRFTKETHRVVGVYADRDAAAVIANICDGEIESKGRYTHIVWKEREDANPATPQ